MRMGKICARALLAGVLACVMVGGAACAPIGYLFYQLNPPRVNPMYQPPKLQPMLVLVENRQNPGMLVAESDQLTAFIMDELKTYEVAPLVPREKLEQLRDSRKDVDKMTISDIGKAVGAEQVLYVDVKRIGLGSIEGVPTHGRAEARVHVVDVKTAKTMFPKSGAEGWPISMETPVTQDVKESDLPLVREQMLRAMGTVIGRLFHEYNPEE